MKEELNLSREPSIWIKCSEQLPLPEQYVLVFLNMDNWIADDQDHVTYGVVCLTINKYPRPDEEAYQWEEFGPSSFDAYEVDYWMHLPERPE